MTNYIFKSWIFKIFRYSRGGEKEQKKF